MLPLITPPQSQPFLEGAMCGRVYYLFFQALSQAAATGGGIVQFGTNRERLTLDTQGLPNGALWLESDTGLVYQWRVSPTSAAWAFALGTQIIDQTLTAGSTTINAPTSGAVDLVMIIRQDATGGRAAVPGAGFSGVSNPFDLGQALANTLCAFNFVLSGGKYVMVSEGPKDMTA